MQTCRGVLRWLLLPALSALAVTASSSSDGGSASGPGQPIRRMHWSSGTSIVDLMAAAEPVILTGSPAESWASEHWSAAELRSRLEILYNVRWSSTQRSFTYFTGKEWDALFGSPMERAAARLARKEPVPLGDWSPGKPKHHRQRRPGLRPESAKPHDVANILGAEDFFAHVENTATNGTVSPPFYYISGAIDEKVVVHEGGAPLLPELTEGLLPQLEPLPQYDIRPHLWLGQPGVSVTLHYDTNDNTYIQLKGSKRFILLPPSAARHVYLHPVHHPHNGQARAHFDLPWSSSDNATITRLMGDFPAFSQVWDMAQEGVVHGGEILLLPANWLHHVATEPWAPNDGSLLPRHGAVTQHELSISVNLWRKCPISCNFAMGHVSYNDEHSQPLPLRRLRLQAFVTAVTRRLLLKHEPLEVGERVMVVYPGPGRNRYPAVLRQKVGIGPSWLIAWEDGDTEHTHASPYSIYRFKSSGDASPDSRASVDVEMYPAATPDRSFAAELLEQRYVGLMEGGETTLMSAEWADAGEGMVHPTDEILEEETSTTVGKEGRSRRWPDLASEVEEAVRAFEAEHDARTLRMYMSDWADNTIGRVLGADDVPWFLLGVRQHPHWALFLRTNSHLVHDCGA